MNFFPLSGGGADRPTETKSRIETRTVYSHEVMNLAIGCCAGQNGKDRRRHYGAKLPFLALGGGLGFAIKSSENFSGMSASLNGSHHHRSRKPSK
jgi:hypothetical protein